MSEKGSTIRGLSIAVTCLSALAIVFALGMAAFSAFAGMGIASNSYNYTSPSMSHSKNLNAGDLGLTPSDIRELRELGVDIDDLNIEIDEQTAYDIAGITIVLMLLASFIFLVSGVLTLVSGILGISRARKPEKMRAVFIWAIVGAVVAFFAGRIITLVLLIILAVEASKCRSEYEAMMAAGGPAMEWNA